LSAILKTARPEDVFQDLFRTHETDQTGSKYRKRLAQVAVTNGKSLVIDFDDLISFDPALARSLVEKPDDYISYASSAATAQMRVEDPEYAEHVGKIFARFRRLPEKTALRKIGAEHIKKIALVDGIVVRTTQVKPTIVSAVFRCRKCLEIIVQDQEGELIRGPGSHCPFCKQSTSFELIQEQSKFKNTQEARIQERPEDLPPGQLPRYLDIRIEDDLVDTARPGDRVSVTSIVRAEKQTVGERGRLRTFNIYLDANFIDVVGKETEVVEITPNDEKQILETSKDPWVLRKLIMSLAPSIYGYEDVKEGILYMLFGGTAKHLPDGVNIRGDQNTLLIGDPGTAKSQLLQYVSRIAPRGLYTSGRGTTAAGLTAAVLREKTGGMVLEAGALVLADKGLAAIDELDKMRPDDRVAIHEALEQQTVCYDEQTEILTELGWRRFRDLLPGVLVATLNVAFQSLEYQEPTKFFTSSYHGEMVSIRSRQVDLLVTPNHTMYVNLNKRGNDWYGFKPLRVDELPLNKRMRFKKNAAWSGKRIGVFELPSCIKIHANKNGRSEHLALPVKIPMDLWLEFLGYYLSEGYTARHPLTGVPYRVFIAQTKKKGVETIGRCLSNLGFKYTYIGHGFYINSKQLASYLFLLGKAQQKHVPRELKQLAPEQLRILLDALILGDGHVAQNGATTYVTSSRQLADDVTELALKVGWSANVYIRSPEEYLAARLVMATVGGGSERRAVGPRELKPTTDSYTVSLIRQGQCEPNINSNGQRHVEKTYYSGKIYCVEVPNHIIYVRRNGKPVWCGNSVAKGGIVATLNARAAVLAAANPSLGRYEPHRNVSENINLPVTILSRFDLIFIIKDQPEPDYDSRMSEHILALHRSKTSPETAPFSPEFLRKYISFAKRITPVLTPEAVSELRDFYLKMRSKGGEEAAVAITPRQLEALVRISEARARAFLRENVTVEDAKSAIRIMTVSLSDVGVDVKTGAMDIDVIMTGKPRSLRDSFQRVIETVAEMERETGTVEETVLIAALVDKEKMEEREARRLIGQLIKEGILYSPKPGRLKRTAG
jgi:replicative DNA helicase Mcm